MGKKLFIGGLAWGTDEDSLGRAFESYGKIREVKIVMDRETGRSRGFGFITFENDADAKVAIADMDGCNVDGRSVRVTEAVDKPRSGNSVARHTLPEPTVTRRGSGNRIVEPVGGQKPSRPAFRNKINQ